MHIEMIPRQQVQGCIGGKAKAECVRVMSVYVDGRELVRARRFGLDTGDWFHQSATSYEAETTGATTVVSLTELNEFVVYALAAGPTDRQDHVPINRREEKWRARQD